MKKVTIRLNPEQIEFLKSDGGISKATRKAIGKAMRKRNFNLTFSRYKHSGWIRISVQAKDENDLIVQVNELLSKLHYGITQPEDWKDWYLYEVKEA